LRPWILLVLAAGSFAACVPVQPAASTAKITSHPVGPGSQPTGPIAWNSADGVPVAGPIVFQPKTGGPRYVAAVVKDGAHLVAVVPRVGRVEVATPAAGMDVTARLASLPVDGGSLLRVDLASGHDDGGGMYAMKTVLVAGDSGKLVTLLDRIVEEADATHDVRATITASGGQLVVDETATGARRATKRLTYRRDGTGAYVTSDSSLFAP
jgi:hypothetical protein